MDDYTGFPSVPPFKQIGKPDDQPNQQLDDLVTNFHCGFPAIENEIDLNNRLAMDRLLPMPNAPLPKSSLPDTPVGQASMSNVNAPIMSSAPPMAGFAAPPAKRQRVAPYPTDSQIWSSEASRIIQPSEPSGAVHSQPSRNQHPTLHTHPNVQPLRPNLQHSSSQSSPQFSSPSSLSSVSNQTASRQFLPSRPMDNDTRTSQQQPVGRDIRFPISPLSDQRHALGLDSNNNEQRYRQILEKTNTMGEDVTQNYNQPPRLSQYSSSQQMTHQQQVPQHSQQSVPRHVQQPLPQRLQPAVLQSASQRPQQSLPQQQSPQQHQQSVSQNSLHFNQNGGVQSFDVPNPRVDEHSSSSQNGHSGMFAQSPEPAIPSSSAPSAPHAENRTPLRQRFPLLAGELSRLANVQTQVPTQLSTQLSTAGVGSSHGSVVSDSELSALLADDRSIIHQLEHISKDAEEAVRRGALLQRLHHQIDRMEVALHIDESAVKLANPVERMETPTVYKSWFELYEDLGKSRISKITIPSFLRGSKRQNNISEGSLEEVKLKIGQLPKDVLKHEPLKYEPSNGSASSLVQDSLNSDYLDEINIDKGVTTERHSRRHHRRWSKLIDFQSYIRTQILIHHSLSSSLGQSHSEDPRSSIVPHLPPQLSITSRESRRTKLLGRLRTEAQMMLRDVEEKKRARLDFIKEVRPFSNQ